MALMLSKTYDAPLPAGRRKKKRARPRKKS